MKIMGDFGGLGIFFVVTLIFPITALIPAFLLQPRHPTFYLLIFLVFDIETVFLYPWAVRFGALGLFALLEMFLFLGILGLGLWYAWKKGALSWK